MKPTACHWGLLLVCVFWILPATADISGRCGDNASWKYHSSDKTLVISGTGSITHGGWNAWSSETTQELISYGQDSIRYVIVEKGITQIGDKTFSNLFQAVAFFLPEGLTSIGNGAFSQCYAAVDIKLPSSLKTISDNAFWDCYSLTGMTIPASVESIGDWVFHGCRSLRYLQVETGNLESSHPQSVFMYSDKGGPLKTGPAWDYDYQTFGHFYRYGFLCMDCLWNWKIFATPEVRALACERWERLLPEFEKVFDEIDQKKSQLATSAAVNESLWEFNQEINEDENLPFEQAVDLLKQNLQSRMDWITENISTIR